MSEAGVAETVNSSFLFLGQNGAVTAQRRFVVDLGRK